MNLYELTEAYQNIQQLIIEGRDDLDDVLAQLDDAIDQKAEGYGRVIRNLEAQVKALREEEKRLADKRRSIENNIKRLKDNLQESMLTNDKRRIETPLFTFRIQKNAPSVRIVDEDLIPKRFYAEQAPKLMRKELTKALKEKEIPGAELQQTESLRIV